MKVKTYKSGRVVIFHCLGISKGFEYGVSLEQLLLQLSLMKMKTTDGKLQKALDI